MKSLPLAARVYILLIVIVATIVIFYSAVLLQNQLTLWLAVLFIAVAIVALDFFPIKVYGGNIEMTISGTARFAAMLLYPPAVVTLAAFLGELGSEIPAKRIW